MAGRFGFDPRYAEAIFHLPPRLSFLERALHWARSLFAEWSGHRVLGRRLRPYSLWHKVQLEFHNSPFLAGGPLTVADVELAVRICRTQFPVAARMPARGRLGRLLWVFRAERVDVVEHRDAFLAFLADYDSGAKLWNTAGSGTRRDVDESIEEVTLYREYTGAVRWEPWNLPIGELYWMNILHARRAGAKVKVWTPTDEREFRKNLKVRAEIIQRLTNEILEREPDRDPADAKKEATDFYWSRVRKNLKKMGAARPGR